MEQAYWENHLYKCKFIIAILQVRHVSLLHAAVWFWGNDGVSRLIWGRIYQRFWCGYSSGRNPRHTDVGWNRKWCPNGSEKWGVPPKLHLFLWGNHDFRWFPTFVEQICCCPHHFAPHFERFSTCREQCMVSDSMCCFRRKSTAFPMAFPMKYGHVRREFSHPFSDFSRRHELRTHKNYHEISRLLESPLRFGSNAGCVISGTWVSREGWRIRKGMRKSENEQHLLFMSTPKIQDVPAKTSYQVDDSPATRYTT